MAELITDRLGSAKVINLGAVVWPKYQSKLLPTILPASMITSAADKPF
jgi:hypothetical protein